MSLTIDLQPDLEAELRREAARAGMDPRSFAVRTLEERLRRGAARPTSAPPSLVSDEAALLKRINRGWPEKKWDRYADLIGRRRTETLTAGEHEELIALGDDLERWNVRRLRDLMKLASLRQTSVDMLMAQLGIKPRNV